MISIFFSCNNNNKNNYFSLCFCFGGSLFFFSCNFLSQFYTYTQNFNEIVWNIGTQTPLNILLHFYTLVISFSYFPIDFTSFGYCIIAAFICMFLLANFISLHHFLFLLSLFPCNYFVPLIVVLCCVDFSYKIIIISFNIIVNIFSDENLIL